jgi:hypothetical protein
MSNLVQVLATATQFPSQLGGGLAPGETPHDQDEHRRAVVCSLKHRPGPGIEDPSTCRAAIIEDGLTKVAMDLESLPGLTARAAEFLWVEHIEEVLITSSLIH